MDPIPARKIPQRERPLWIPVGNNASGSVTLRFGSLPEGGRVALAFTTREALDRVLGAGHPAIRLAPEALRAMLAPLGVAEIRVDVAGALDKAVLAPGTRELRVPSPSAA
ncbi:hypothetical protein EDD29_8969 [Actinocorallia herbida]|uniref:Type III secretion system (T3SS) SseB-like protein n=1 Tax=Actinocorallia herbida TaxID=58109 RepID=A0A3N1DDG1_9ACTN|nr:SAV_915 family protein [Actinocorallia herbida]ROO91218.1 hypothetical protein EDD29_8969 [Actinocorallia herbida]